MEKPAMCGLLALRHQPLGRLGSANVFAVPDGLFKIRVNRRMNAPFRQGLQIRCSRKVTLTFVTNVAGLAVNLSVYIGLHQLRPLPLVAWVMKLLLVVQLGHAFSRLLLLLGIDHVLLRYLQA